MPRVTFSFFWPLRSETTRELLHFAFLVATANYLVFYLIETMRVGFVEAYYSLNTMFWIAVGVGLVSLLWPVESQAQRRQPYTKSVAFGLALFGGMAVWVKTDSIGIWGLLLAVGTGAVVIGLSWLARQSLDDSS